jgi:hypothetical protein
LLSGVREEHYAGYLALTSRYSIPLDGTSRTLRRARAVARNAPTDGWDASAVDDVWGTYSVATKKVAGQLYDTRLPVGVSAGHGQPPLEELALVRRVEAEVAIVALDRARHPVGLGGSRARLQAHLDRHPHEE